MLRGQQLMLRLALGAAGSLLVLGLLFHLLAGDRGMLTPAELMGYIRRVVPALFLLSLVCRLAQALFRALRYRLLLRAGGGAGDVLPGFFHLLLVTLTRNMFVDLLPARAGELSYIALLNRGYGVGGDRCLSSLSISFVFDFAALAAVVLVIVAERLLAGPFPLLLAVLAVALFVISAIGLLVLLFALPSLAHRLRRLAHNRIAVRATAFLDRVGGAFTATRKAGVLGMTLLYSLAVRFWKYAGIWFMFEAVTRNNFPALAGAPLGTVLTTLVTAEAAASLPIPSLMGFGVYEAGGTAALIAQGFDAGSAALCMFVVHAVTQAIDYTIGGCALLLITFLARRRGAGPAPGTSPRRTAALAAGLILLVTAAALAIAEFRKVRSQGALTPPPAGHDVAPAVPPAAAPRLPKGFVVWSSNRSGNHDIWRMELPSRRIRQITRHPHAEYYPRISPDGRRLLLSRSRQPWVSQRRKKEWDVILLDLRTGEERILSGNATAARWMDNRRIVFQQDAVEVVSLDTESGERKVLARAGEGAVPAGAELGTPDVRASDGALAVTLRGGARMTAIIRPGGSLQRTGGGCQMSWSPDGRFLYMVDDTIGRMSHSFRRIVPGSRASELLFDAPLPWSHEYFPTLSRDGRWLVYGACEKGHEHDTTDYEIFLWHVGDPPESALRLTWHTGNDAWPDIHLDP